MRNLWLASAAAFGVVVAVTAMAQPASNITPSDTRSTIAPKLPGPAVSADSGPREYLQAARDALAGNRTGEAQEALERAEARVLDRSTAPTATGPDQRPMVQRISDAREALGRGDKAGAERIIDEALAAPSHMGSASTAAAAPPAPLVTPPAPVATTPDGSVSAVPGMPVAGMTVYNNRQIPLPSSDDSMTFKKSGENSFTVRATPTREDPAMDVGPAAGNGTSQ